MAQFIEVPCTRLDPRVLQALLEDYASRDGTDYGAVEHSLEQKVSQLLRQLQSAELQLLYDADSEEWDLVGADSAGALLAE